MSVFAFRVDIEDSSGNKLGGGPLTTASRWRYTSRFDRAGEIDFEFSASDAQAAYVTNRTVARAYALLNNTWVEVGAGTIDQIDTVPRNDGSVSLRASGLDLIGELRYRNVGELAVGTTSGTTHSAAVTQIGGIAPSGWTFTAAASPANDYIYARFDGESVLGAFVYVADRTQTHFYRGSGRTLIFTSTFDDSGIRAIRADGALAAETCAITSLRRTVDTHELLTRITPYGSGTGNARLTLAATSRTAPTGYTLDKANNYIEDDGATATYGLINHPQVEFKEITPISNTTADLQAAANMLYDAALYELQRRATLATQETFDITVAGCSALLRPMQTIRVIYRDVSQNINIDENLYILEATWDVGPQGVYTSKLVVSTDDRWPDSDLNAAADRAAQGRIFQAHPQMGPNEWWENSTLFIGSDQTDHVGDFPFVLGNAIVTVQQVLFRYKVTNVINFTSIITGSSTTSGSSSSSTSDAGSSHSHTVTIAGHTHTIPNHVHTFTIIGNGAGALTYDIGYGAGGTAGGMRHNIDSTDHTVSTNSGSGGTTSDSGGSSSPTSASESAHSHGIAHTHTVTPDIAIAYGVYKAAAGRTYAIGDLEYRVNAGSWVSLDTGTSVGDSYYELDITADVSDTTTFRPDQENNSIEIRRKGSAGQVAINSSQGDGSTVGIDTGATAHGLSLGETVIITGTTYHNGTWKIIEVTSDYVFRTDQSGDSNTEGAVGYAEVNKSAMILAKLGIRTTIQAVALT